MITKWQKKHRSKKAKITFQVGEVVMVKRKKNKKEIKELGCIVDISQRNILRNKKSRKMMEKEAFKAAVATTSNIFKNKYI